MSLEGTRRYLGTTGLIFMLLALPSAAPANFSADSSALYGTWRWERSWGGLMGADVRASESWADLLTLRRDGTYLYWQRDSLHNYRRASGTFAIHPPSTSIGGGPKLALWIELAGWPSSYDARQLVTYVTADEINCYPGGGDLTVDDALTTSYRRDNSADRDAQGEKFEATIEPDSLRPPRIWKHYRAGHWLEWPSYLKPLQHELGRVVPWGPGLYPDAVRQQYPYAANQDPAFVIGDFDGDGLDDFAMQGSTDSASVVYFLVSGFGSARAIEVLREESTTVVDGSGRAVPAPPSYLQAALPGTRAIVDRGQEVTLEHGGVLVIRENGGRTAYWMDSGTVRHGSPAIH